MDGGVLENKPFTSTIDAIFSRLADRQVSRYLLYVDPDPVARAFVARRIRTPMTQRVACCQSPSPPPAAYPASKASMRTWRKWSCTTSK